MDLDVLQVGAVLLQEVHGVVRDPCRLLKEVPRDCELLQVLYKSLRYLLDGALTNLRAVFKLDHMKALMDSTKLFNTI